MTNLDVGLICWRSSYPGGYCILQCLIVHVSLTCDELMYHCIISDVHFSYKTAVILKSSHFIAFAGEGRAGSRGSLGSGAPATLPREEATLGALHGVRDKMSNHLYKISAVPFWDVWNGIVKNNRDFVYRFFFHKFNDIFLCTIHSCSPERLIWFDMSETCV